MSTADLFFKNLYKDHDPPARKNMEIDDIPGTRAPHINGYKERTDYDGLQLGYVPSEREYMHSKKFFKVNPKIKEKMHLMLKHGHDVHDNCTGHTSKHNYEVHAPESIKTHYSNGAPLKPPTHVQELLQDEEVYDNMNDVQQSQYPDVTKYKKYVRYMQDSRDKWDGAGKDDHIYKIWHKKPLADRDHMLESVNWGDKKHTASQNLKLGSNYGDTQESFQQHQEERNYQETEDLKKKTRFVSNLANFYDIPDNDQNNKFLNHLDKSKEYIGMTGNPNVYQQVTKIPATLDTVIPGSDYVAPENLCYIRDDENLADKHFRLSKEIDEVCKAKRKNKAFRISAYDNPFFANKSPEHMKPSSNFSQNKSMFNNSNSVPYGKNEIYKNSILKGSKDKNPYSTPNLLDPERK